VEGYIKNLSRKFWLNF